MKKLFITKNVPPRAAILLIDVEERYFDELLEEYEEDDRITDVIEETLQTMKNTLSDLKSKGHPIISSTNGGVHFLLEGFVDEELPQWDSEGVMDENEDDIALRHALHPLVIEKVASYSSVVVCGLWKELCVYIVARKLQEHYGSKVMLLDHDGLSLSDGLSLDAESSLNLKEVCARDGVSIEMAGTGKE